MTKTQDKNRKAPRVFTGKRSLYVSYFVFFVLAVLLVIVFLKMATHKPPLAGGTALICDSSGNVFVAGHFSEPSNRSLANRVIFREPDYIFSLFSTKFDSNGKLDRIGSMTRSTMIGRTSHYPSGIAIGQQNEVYIAGGVYGEVITYQNYQTASNTPDAFIEKTNPGGWFLTWGGMGDDQCFAVIVDNAGNIYVTGGFQQTVDFDPANGRQRRVSNGDMDIFVSRFDSSSAFQEVYTWGGSGKDVGGVIACDSFNNIYVAGYFEDAVDFDPGAGIEILSSEGERDCYVSKLDSQGNLQWARSWGGENRDMCSGMAIDSSDCVYIVGVFSDLIDIDPNDGIGEHSSEGGTDILLVKFDPNGNLEFSKTWGGNGDDDVFGVAVNRIGEIYVTGGFEGTVDFDPDSDLGQYSSSGDKDVFLCKFSTEGEFEWVNTWGEEGYWNAGRTVVVDSQDNVFVTGTCGGHAFVRSFFPDGSLQRAYDELENQLELFLE